MNVGGPAPGARPVTGGASSPPAAPTSATAPQGQTPGAAQAAPMPPGSLAMKMPPGFQPPGGGLLFAKVAGKDAKGYLMQVGQHLVRAQSGTQLQVGQSVQMRVQGETGGNLQLLLTGQTGKHSAADIANSLSSMKIPLSEGTMETAKAMVEHKVPLSKDNLQNMQQQTRLPEGMKNPPPMSTRVSAVVFLQQNQLPVTPQNVASLGNFLAMNPQIGQQMAAMNEELRRLVDRGSDSSNFESVREMVLSAIDGQGGGTMGKTREKKVPPKKFFNAAKQAGIEFGPGPFPGSGEDEWEVLAAYRELRRRTGSVLGERFETLLAEAEDNVLAQRLLNQFKEGELGCLYFQVPIRLDPREEAEIWLYYRRKRGDDDEFGDEFRAEFSVSTEHLGVLLFIVEASGIDAQVTIEVEEAPALEFVSRYSGVLQERLLQAGWRSSGVQVQLRKTVTGNLWVQRESIQEMESYDVQA